MTTDAGCDLSKLKDRSEVHHDEKIGKQDVSLHIDPSGKLA
jgi:hypothetical protein